MEAKLATKAADIMSTPVFTASPNTPVEEIAAVLGRHRISSVPVVDAGEHVVGLVSEYDLLAKSGSTAAEVMSTAVISVSIDTVIADIRRMLIDQRLRHLPVLQDGRLAGIVSRRDIVALLATEWVCGVCGEPTRGEHPPGSCPKCAATGDRFTLQEQPPGP
ncbi:CBS domain-containing protein [Arthrobacter sp. H5]|uniref:CBS domain-containing protein n=1 Tax=Arthrobacter sp. H5 TaxID=1267973 RepID=UPI000489EFE2|nr:CBS domain-containing protein [Arthrobacter sp. H5]